MWALAGPGPRPDDDWPVFGACFRCDRLGRYASQCPTARVDGPASQTSLYTRGRDHVDHYCWQVDSADGQLLREPAEHLTGRLSEAMMYEILAGL